MSVVISPIPKLQFNQSNLPLAGGLLFTYAAGTTTKRNTYTDATGTTPNANPIVLNSNGEASVYLSEGVLYKFTLSNPLDTDPPANPYWTVDNIYGSAFFSLPYADAGGTADVITASYLVNSEVLDDGYPLLLDIGTTNATTTPTFAPTLNGVAKSARTIVKFVGNVEVPLAIGDLQGVAMLIYNSANTTWILQNPSTANAAVATVNRAYTTAGTSTAYTLSPVPAITAYAANQTYDVIFNQASGAAPTISISGKGSPPNLVYQNADGTYTNIASGQIPSGWQSTVKLVSASQALVTKLPLLTASPKLPTISATVASSALTIGASTLPLDFRSATLTDGSITTINAAPAALVVPSTATLGTTSAVQSRLLVLELLNAGITELAVVNESGALKLDESAVISTTAISAAADSASVIYSTTARTNVPFRVIGFIESTQATAGTWATAPSTIQGLSQYPATQVTRETFTVSGLWTKPSWLTGNEIIKVEIWGGGAGGGGGGSIGGGGGAYNSRDFLASELSPTETVTVAVAAAANTDGGTTSFGTRLYAYGGGAGAGKGGSGGGTRGAGQATSVGGLGYSATVGAALGANAVDGGGGGGANPGGGSFWGGGGGSTGGQGGCSTFGGGGGGGAGGTGGVSLWGGAGGADGGNGVAPGGGGGATSGTGARGECRVTILRVS